LYVKTIVIDVDDTISTHVDRDYKNAIPHVDVISKINAMYAAGWKIVLHTARGVLSLNGDVEKIEAERGPILREWLDRHGVRYHELVFGKPLALAYVDDKAMRPDEFVRADFGVLSGGSGSSIDRFGDRVIKTATNVREQTKWFKKFSRLGVDFVSAPKVIASYHDVLDIEYVEGRSLNDSCESRHVSSLLRLIGEFSTIPPISDDWATMVSRVESHASLNSFPYQDEIMKIIRSESVASHMLAEASFCHGDMTLENAILTKDDRIYLIDPNTPDGVYTSWLLDLGKLYQSLRYDYEGTFRSSRSRVDKPALLAYTNSLLDEEDRAYGALCECVHYVRMIKYKNEPEKKLVMANISDLYEKVISECF
jgi:capsule biosynthesis phosphatase